MNSYGHRVGIIQLPILFASLARILALLFSEVFRFIRFALEQNLWALSPPPWQEKVRHILRAFFS